MRTHIKRQGTQKESGMEYELGGKAGGGGDTLEASVADVGNAGAGGAPWGGKWRRGGWGRRPAGKDRLTRPPEWTGERGPQGLRSATKPPSESPGSWWGNLVAEGNKKTGVERLPKGRETSGVTSEGNRLIGGDVWGQRGD